MKKYLLICISYLLGILTTSASSLKNDMLPNSNSLGINQEGTDALTQVLVYGKNFIFSVLGLVAIAVFLYFGFKLISARGNEEEFKKALMGFMYAVIGLSIIPLAWGVVKIISTLKF